MPVLFIQYVDDMLQYIQYMSVLNTERWRLCCYFLFDHCAESEGEEHVDELKNKGLTRRAEGGDTMITHHQNNHSYGHSSHSAFIVFDLQNE